MAFIKILGGLKSIKTSNLKALYELFPEFLSESRDGFEEFHETSVDADKSS